MKEMGQAIELDKLEALLANVDRRAQVATSPSAKARMYNLAGELCFDAHQPQRALHYYEQAVTTCISADQFDNAIAICKTLLTLTPLTVRLNYALPWVKTLRRVVGDTRRRISKYADAAENAGLGKLARRHLVGLAEMIRLEETLDAIMDDVERLGPDVTADWIYEELNRMNGKPAA